MEFTYYLLALNKSVVKFDDLRGLTFDSGAFAFRPFPVALY